MDDHETSVENLKDRVSDLEECLRQAGLLEKPKYEGDSGASPKGKTGLKRSKSQSSRDDVGEKRSSGLSKWSQKDTNGKKKLRAITHVSRRLPGEKTERSGTLERQIRTR